MNKDRNDHKDTNTTDTHETAFEINEKKQSELSVINRITNIFIEPSKTFKDIKVKGNILKPGLILMVIFAVIYWLQIDLLREQVLNQLKSMQAINPDFQITDEAVKNALRAGVIMGVLSALINPVFKGLLVHGVALLQGGKAKMKATLSTLVYSYFIIGLGQFILAFIKNYTGNAYLTLSPALFLKTIDPLSTTYAISSYFDIFTIGYLLISIIGIKIVHEVSYRKASIAVLLPSVMYILILLASTLSSVG